MLKWSLEREARWMLWLSLPLPILALVTVLGSRLARLCP